MSPLRFFTAEDPDMARVRAIRRQVFVQDLGVPEQQEFDAADLPGADTVYALLTAEGSPLGTGRLPKPNRPLPKLHELSDEEMERLKNS